VRQLLLWPYRRRKHAYHRLCTWRRPSTLRFNRRRRLPIGEAASRYSLRRARNRTEEEAFPPFLKEPGRVVAHENDQTRDRSELPTQSREGLLTVRQLVGPRAPVRYPNTMLGGSEHSEATWQAERVRIMPPSPGYGWKPGLAPTSSLVGIEGFCRRRASILLGAETG
jgi:hypothetical protein